MAKKIVTLERLTTFLANVKNWATNTFVSKENGKGLSTNDYTTDEKNKLSGLTATKVDTVKVDGVELTPDGNKAVNIDIASKYATKDEVSAKVAAIYRPKGSITWADLIALSNATEGDVYNVTDKAGMNYVCIKSNTAGEASWDALGATIDLTPYMKTVDADAKYALKSHTHAMADITGLNTALTNKWGKDELVEMTDAEIDALFA